MQTVIQIGAGAIGRGFLAELWCGAGYETVFVDANQTLVAQINRRGAYPLHLVTQDTQTAPNIAPVRAIWTGDTDAVQQALAVCDFAATAVGANRIETVARTLIAPALPHRAAPLNVLLCENGSDVRHDFLRGLGDAANGVGAVETVVGRMVPEPVRDPSDPLTVIAEPFRELPFCAAHWQGDLPRVDGLIAVPGALFPTYHLRKLFVHNGGHALLAYQGYQRGHEYLWQCAADATLAAELRGFWSEVGTAFQSGEYRDAPIFAPEALAHFCDNLLYRFGNAHLGDTVERVARDPVRKLAAHDRLVGAALLCLAQGVEPVYIVRAIRAALRYDARGDSAAQTLAVRVAAQGDADTLREIAGLVAGHPLLSRL